MRTLDKLIAEAKAKVDAMSPEELEAMRKAKRESYVRAELNWPAPKFRFVNSVKTYDSYEDYCND